MSVYLKLPTGLTFAKARIAVPALNITVGGANPFWDQVLELGIAGSIVRGRSDDALAVYGPIENTRWLDLDSVAAAVAAGGDCEGLLVFAQVTPTDPVPEGLPGRTYPEIGEDGEPTGVDLVHTWESWKSPHHQFHERVEGTYLRLIRNDVDLKASEWVPLRAAGLTVIGAGEFQELTLPEEATP